MNDVQRKLLSLLSHSLFGANSEDSLTPEICIEAKLQAVSTLISQDYSTLATNIRVINAHAELTRRLNGIPFTTFKGYASAYYYPEPSLRPMGDVDFITEPDHYDTVVKFLENNGWEKSAEEHCRHRTYRKDNISFELHNEIKGIPNGLDGIVTDSKTAESKVRGYLSDLVVTAKAVETGQGLIVIPDDFHHGLIMLLHVAGHLINDGGIGLRHLCDWAVYVDQVNLEKYRNKLEDIGLWTFACQLTAVSTRYLGLRKMEWASEWPEEFLAEFIEDILRGGNFGRKETGSQAILRIEKASFIEIIQRRYPISKNRGMLPFCIILYIFRYSWLVLVGKRKIITPSTIEWGKRRKQLYDKFQLFDVE